MYLYESDYLQWLRVIRRIPYEHATPDMKLLAMSLPDILDMSWERYEKKRDEAGIFEDREKGPCILVSIRDIELATGMNPRGISRSIKRLHNCDVIYYRFFREPYVSDNGGYWRTKTLSYMQPQSKLWNGNIRLLPGQERGRGYNQKHYKPVCVDCYSEALQPTGGVEYKCFHCGKVHVYYPEK